MARHGITYQDVANAANQLKGQEKNITIENVRAALGTGSISTINNHLRQWKRAQDETANIANKENLPPELVSLIKGLWQQVLHQSEQQTMALEQAYQTSVAELEQELHKYKNNNQRWQQLYNQWLQEKNQLANDQQVLQQGIEALHKENNDVLAKNHTLEQQLQEKQERIIELHRLHQQAQTNLEHYREAAREQRLLDQQQFEQQKLELQCQLKTEQDHAMALTEKSIQAQQQCLALQQTYTALEKAHQGLTVLYEGCQSALKENEKRANDSEQQCHYLKMQFQKAEEKAEAKTDESIRLQTENKLLAQGLTKAQEQLAEALAQNKLLSHDKWALSQEKSQLLGQLTQVEKMITRENASLV